MNVPVFAQCLVSAQHHMQATGLRTRRLKVTAVRRPAPDATVGRLRPERFYMSPLYQAAFDAFKEELQTYGDEIFLYRLSFTQVNRLAMLAATVAEKCAAQQSLQATAGERPAEAEDDTRRA